MNDWKIFRGNRDSGNEEASWSLPDPPSWRRFQPQPNLDEADLKARWQQILDRVNPEDRDYQRGKKFRVMSPPAEENSEGAADKKAKATYQAYKEMLEGVNAAIYLRRPLLISGRPGSGKTTLAYAIAYELQLGSVLSWPITTRTTLQDGLYRYDAIARLQSLQILKLKQELGEEAVRAPEENIGQYLRLGALGTAFLPSYKPRVLLLDEIDKSDINFPNDLLNLFEEGGYTIPELERLGDGQIPVKTADAGMEISIRGGRVQCRDFPIVVMTSNGERDFPPAFLRRCLRVRMPEPSDRDFLARVVEAHFTRDLGEDNWQQSRELVNQLIEMFVTEKMGKTVATDQLLSTIYLFSRQVQPNPSDRESLKRLLLKRLDGLEDR